MKKRKYKQLLASVIACSMVLSGMPATAYAAGNDTAQEVQSEDQTSGTAGLEDSSNAGQQENAGNQTTAGTNESTSTESDSNSQTNSSQDNTSKNNTAQSGTSKNNTAQSGTTQNNTAQSGTTQNNTASQPAAADAQSAQDAKAVKAGNVLEIHKGETIKGVTLLGDFKGWFGDATKYRYKTNASTDDWNEIALHNSLTKYTLASGTVTVEKYIKTGWSGIKPKMEWVQAGTFTVKNYSNVTFNVTNIEGAGVKIDGTAVTDTVKSYDTENKTFTVNDVDGYDVTVKNGETPMTPNANGSYTLPVTDATINVVYEATAGAFVNVTNPKNGKITIDGQNIASKKVALNSTYTVNVTPDNGYAVENIFVNNNPVEDVTYANQTATVTLKTGDLDNKIFNITAQTVQCKLDVKDAEVSYHNGMSTDKVAQNIFAAVVGTDNVPDITLNDVTIEYDASLTGLGKWKAIGYQPSGLLETTFHKFGKSTEKIRITYNGTDKYPSMQKTATITLKDLREETTLSINDGIMMKYQSAEMMDAVIKVLIAQNATVTDKEGNKIETTADDFTYTPSTDEWKAGEQEITVTYNGNEDYLSSSATTTITIKKGDAKVWVNSQNIKYGESFSQIFASDPSDAAPLGMIVGIDGNGKSFVGFDVSNIVIKQKVPGIGTTIKVPLEQAILALVPDGKVNVGNLMNVINKLPNFGDNKGIISAVQKVVDQILKIYPAAADWSISFKRPTESGVYLAVGASTSQNYNTAVGVGYLTIAPRLKDVKLEFNSPLPKNCTLTYEEAQEFDFSGKATQNGQTVNANIKTKYVGVTADGKWVSSKGNEPKDALREPGNYVEKIYTVGGNYVAAPIVRCYTVKKAETEIRFDSIDLEVPYDGQPHGITAGVYHGNERIAEADIIYMSSSGYKSAEKPTDAGMYQVMASYKGDSKYACVDAKYTRLFIKQKVVTVTPNAPQNPIYYRDQMPEFTYTVIDEKGNVLSEEEIASLGTVSVVKTPEDVTPGHYTIKAQVENANKNYDITCGDTTFDILARPITIKTMDMAIEYGDDVPDVDYYIYDMNGELADSAIVSGADFPSLDFSIEGQDEGKHLAASTTPYAINVSGLDNANFEVRYEGGSLTVNPRKINISIDSKKKVEGDADPELTYTVSRATGEAVAQAVEDTAAASAVVEGDELGVTLTREAGETVGLYDIYANVEGLNSNYALAETPDGTDKFEIVKKGTIIDDNKKPSDQNPSGDKTTVKGDNKNNKNTNTAKKADNTKKNQPKTGDNSHVMFYLFMIEAAMVAAFITLIFRRRRRS